MNKLKAYFDEHALEIVATTGTIACIAAIYYGGYAIGRVFGHQDGVEDSIELLKFAQEYNDSRE